MTDSRCPEVFCACGAVVFQSQDTERFGFCNTFQAGFPSGFLLLERYSWLLAGIIDSTRPMDNMCEHDTPSHPLPPSHLTPPFHPPDPPILPTLLPSVHSHAVYTAFAAARHVAVFGCSVGWRLCRSIACHRPCPDMLVRPCGLRDSLHP